MEDKQIKILDIAMNLNRIGNWAADNYEIQHNKINFFLDQTTNYIGSLDESSLSGEFTDTFHRFRKEYKELAKAGKQGPDDIMFWAEKMMTWGNILTHRAKLA